MSGLADPPLEIVVHCRHCQKPKQTNFFPPWSWTRVSSEDFRDEIEVPESQHSIQDLLEAAAAAEAEAEASATQPLSLCRR